MPGYLSRNNKLDRANKTLKDDYTLCVKLRMAELNKMQEAITSWSLNEGQDSFKDHKTYCLRDWEDAWWWHCKSPKILHFGADLSGSILGAGPIAPTGVHNKLDCLSSS